jgi:hypothetical protein
MPDRAALLRRLQRLPAGWPIDVELHATFCVVLQGRRPAGLLISDQVALFAGSSVGQLMLPLGDDDFVSPETDIYGLVRLLGRHDNKRPWLLVRKRSRLYGFVHARGLFSLRGRLAFLELVLGLESLALTYLAQDPGKSAAGLSPGRRTAALENLALYRGDLERLHPDTPEHEWLPMTSFLDKGTMLAKLLWDSPADGKAVIRTFRRAERLRNACAHTGPPRRMLEFSDDPTSLADLLQRVEHLSHLLRARLPWRLRRRFAVFGPIPVDRLLPQEE